MYGLIVWTAMERGHSKEIVITKSTDNYFTVLLSLEEAIYNLSLLRLYLQYISHGSLSVCTSSARVSSVIYLLGNKYNNTIIKPCNMTFLIVVLGFIPPSLPTRHIIWVSIGPAKFLTSNCYYLQPTLINNRLNKWEKFALLIIECYRNV